MSTAEQLNLSLPVFWQEDVQTPIEKAAFDVATRIKDVYMAPLISLPDSEGTPTEQLDNQFSDSSPYVLNVNRLALLGMAAHKARQAAAVHLEPEVAPLIMGQHPSETVREFFAEDENGSSLASSMHLHLQNVQSVFRVLKKYDSFDAANLPYVTRAIKTSVDKKLWLDLYRRHGDATELNPKLAFLWGGVTSWGAQYMNPVFNDWLTEMRTRAKYQIVLDAMQKTEAGDQQIQKVYEGVLKEARLFTRVRALGDISTRSV